jgi:hypothetical protein
MFRKQRGREVCGGKVGRRLLGEVEQVRFERQLQPWQFNKNESRCWPLSESEHRVWPVDTRVAESPTQACTCQLSI